MALNTSKLETAVNDFATKLTSDSLATTGEATLPEPKVNAQTEALGGSVEEQIATFEKGLQTQVTEQKGATTSALEDLTKAMAGRTGFEGLSLQAEQETGVAGFERDLIDINDQMRREEMSRRRAVERIQSEGGGLKTGAQSEISNINRESYAKQADLAIVQLAAQGKYDSAKAIADRKAKALFEEQENRIEARKFFYQENKDLFTKSEQRLFDVQFSNYQRKLDNERADYETLQNVKLKALQMAQTNGAPASVLSSIQGAQTPEEVLQVGGQWGAVDMLDRERIRSTMANQALDRKIKLLELALGGDKNAIDELGYDPRNTELTTEELQNNADAYRQNQQDINRVNEMMSNDRGLQAVSGGFRMPKTSGFFTGATPSWTSPLASAPLVGNIMGALESRDAAASFISDVNYIAKNLTLNKFLELKAQGATFGAMSEAEWRIIGDAADEISSMAVYDGDKIVGFSVPEGEVRQQLLTIQEQYKIVNDRLNQKAGLSTSDAKEIDNIMNE